MKWQSKEGLTDLAVSLVEYGSVTGSPEEIGIVEFIEYELRHLPYFQKNGEYLQTHFTEDGRKLITALVKGTETTNNTIILTGHLDVVDVEDYGEWKHLAFRPKELTTQMLEQKHLLPKPVQRDLENDEWLFGRGVMDMKAGIALCMSMVEAASEGEFTGNILFLGVPDEEVNSLGMRTATPILLDLAERYNLNYEIIWNTEPVFAKYPGDEQIYIYEGTIGKMLPGFYCYGQEAHAAEPFSGLNGNFMASHITDAIELNPLLSEKVDNEKTPPPSNLLQRDLKEDYSVQIPHAAVSMFNLMVMKRTVKEITHALLDLAKDASEKILQEYEKREIAFSQIHHYQPKKRRINVITFQELWKCAVQKVGHDEVERRVSLIQAIDPQKDERELSFLTVHEIASICKDMAPMFVLFYAPPYYPAVSSKGDSKVEELTNYLMKEAKEQTGISIELVNYFPGLSDLSYTSIKEEESSLDSLTSNMPLWKRTYDLPLEAMSKLNLSVINFGPLGRDAHSWTERLNLTYSFDQLPHLMKQGIHRVFMRR